MTDEQFITIFKQHADSVEHNMAQGFKVIAAEMKGALADRDSKIVTKVAEVGSSIGVLTAGIEKLDREVTLIFKKTDGLETDVATLKSSRSDFKTIIIPLTCAALAAGLTWLLK